MAILQSYALDLELEQRLAILRRGARPGSVQDIHRKHLLSLVARKDPCWWTLVPRSYIITADRKAAASEWEMFKQDFELSHYLVLIRNHLQARGPTHGDSSRQCHDDEFGELLEYCMPLLSSTFAEIDVAASSNAALVLEEVYQQHPHLQASMLQRNRWLAKPVDGAMGKGIVLFGNISSSEDLSVSYLPFAGRASEGYVLQKYLENPHLVNIRLLIEVGDRRCERAAVAEIGEELCYKYNLRILVVIRWAEDPSVWVYDQGYIDLCPSPFAQACGEEVQEAHISNLAVHAKCTPAIRKRMWSTDTFGQYLQQTIGRDVWAEDIVPQVRNAVARIISCAMPLQAGGDRRKESEGSSVRQPWRRFGFDFALDSDLHAWLIEANHRPGMKAPKGMAGEDKRELLERFYVDERELCGSKLQETRERCGWHIANFHRVPVQQSGCNARSTSAFLNLCLRFQQLTYVHIGKHRAC